MVGVDFVGEKKMNQWLGPTKSNRAINGAARQKEVKAEHSEAVLICERENSAVEDGHSSVELTGRHTRDVDAHSVTGSVQVPSKSFGLSNAYISNAEEEGASVSGRNGRDGAGGRACPPGISTSGWEGSALVVGGGAAW